MEGVESLSVGVVSLKAPEELHELKAALEGLTRSPVGQEPLPPLAGPNELAQILLDPAHWAKMIYVLASVFGLAFVKKTGELSAQEFWTNKSKLTAALRGASARAFLRVVSAIKALRERDQEVLIGIRVPNSFRNASVSVRTDDALEIAFIVLMLALYAEEIARVIEAHRDDRGRVGGGPSGLMIQLSLDGHIHVMGQKVT